MSILDVFIENDRAIVMTDTQGLPVIAPRGTADFREPQPAPVSGAAGVPLAIETDASKVFALPHIPAVIAGRGNSLAIYATVMTAMHAGATFDELDDILARAAADTLTGLESQPAFRAVPGMHNMELALCGWSQRHGRMTFAFFKQENRNHGFERLVTGDWLMSPWPPKWGAAPTPPADHAGRVGLAKRQARELRWAGMAGGGDLVTVVVQRDRLQFDLTRRFVLPPDPS